MLLKVVVLTMGVDRSAVQDVDLVEAADLTSSMFSGGMKRRLSTAIAFTGDPQIVYLDEVSLLVTRFYTR